MVFKIKIKDLTSLNTNILCLVIKPQGFDGNVIKKICFHYYTSNGEGEGLKIWICKIV